MRYKAATGATATCLHRGSELLSPRHTQVRRQLPRLQPCQLRARGLVSLQREGADAPGLHRRGVTRRAHLRRPAAGLSELL